MELSLEYLKTFHPLVNKVVVKPVVKLDTISHGSLTLKAVNWDAFKNQPIVCKVVCPPRKLVYGKRVEYVESVEEMDLTSAQKVAYMEARKRYKYSETTPVVKPIEGSMMWKTTVQVKENDVVWVNSQTMMMSEHRGMTMVIDGDVYYIMNYYDLYLKKSGDDVKMLNGWVLAELVDDPDEWVKKAEKSGLVVPKLSQKKFSDSIGVVKYIGEPVEYLLEDEYDHPEIKAGDCIMFQWRVNRRLEPGQKFFAKDGELVVTRRSRIMAIMN